MSRIHSGTTTTRILSTRLLIMLSIVLLSLSLLALLPPQQAAQAQPDLALPDVPDADTWVVDGYVNAMATDGNVTYIGGGFGRVGPNTGSGVIFDAPSDVPVSPYLRIDYDVYASAGDGSGGWYIGGYFQGVGGMERNYMAHILPDGSLDSAWDPDIDGPVYGIAAGGGNVYICGYFDNVGGQPRNYLAALNASTGAVTGWDPDPDYFDPYYSDLAFDGGVVYVGSNFSYIGGQNRNNLAALDATTGAATAWDPDPNSSVYSLAVDGGVVYVGGNFWNIDGQPRDYLAALDASTGAATAWNPDPNSTVYDLAFDGGIVYVSGSFNNIGLQNRTYLAAVDATTGLANGFNPNPGYFDPYSSSLAVDGSTIYVGGNFYDMGGQPRNNLAAVDAATGAATAWDPDPDSTVRTLSTAGGKVFVGGYFNIVGGVYRDCLAALDASGRPTDWDPGADSEVEALAVAGGLVYAGGYFGFVGGQPRDFLAALDASTGAATAWDPGADSDVYCLSVADGLVYAGGSFRNIGGQPRNYLAAVDATTGAATAWDPKCNDYVYDLEASHGLVYAGGEFTSIGGQPRNRIAALDAAGAATGWNPDADDAVICLTVHDGLVYAGGFFTRIGGQQRYNIAALDSVSGMATGWNPGADSIVSALAMQGNTVYAGGFFSYIGNNLRVGLAGVDAAGNSTAWDPNGYMEYYFIITAAGESGSLQQSAKAGEAPEKDKQEYRDLMASGEPTRETSAIGPGPGPGYYYGIVSELLFSGNTLYVSGFFDAIGPYSQRGIATFTDTMDTWYMAEGSTAGGMETWILVENSNDGPVTVDLTFDTAEGQVVPPELQGVYVPADTRLSFNAGSFVDSYNVSSTVTSHGGTVACERALYGAGRTWASSSLGTRAPSTAWYLAEGATAGGMETWVLVQNPGDEAVSVDVSFLTGSGEYSPSVLQNYDLAAHHRISIYAGTYVNDFNVSTRVVTDGGGVVCERSTYGPANGDGLGTWATSSMGAKGPSRAWYLAEGATDEGRETWVLVENPYDLPVDVNLSFTSSQGEVQGPVETIPGRTRRSYRANDYITAGDVATTIMSSGGGVICERAFYGPARNWATTSLGSPVAANHWDMPEGATDGGMETWVLVYNPGDDTTFVCLSLLTGEGLVQPPELQNLDLAAHERLTVCVNNFVTTFHVSTHVDATSGVVCERSIYWPASAGAAQSWATCSQGAY
ncbi:MAG: PQQ-binding-like beta-propeller repeat protein [Actinobacteria bacterium]|nr:PQQ-binding-like beta-propeller repeat protein [Actinomycetota bacterium]